jgi:hypothetical protein
MNSSDRSNGIRHHVFDTSPDTECHKYMYISLDVPGGGHEPGQHGEHAGRHGVEDGVPDGPPHRVEDGVAIGPEDAILKC